MGASSDTPSYSQAGRLLTEIEKLNRTVDRMPADRIPADRLLAELTKLNATADRIRSQLDGAGRILLYSGWTLLYIILLIPFLVGIGTLARNAVS